MQPDQSPGPSLEEWAHANMTVVKIAKPDGGDAIYQLRKEMVINDVKHVQFVWLNQSQLRAIGIDHGL
jgi:hypothetical protein